MKNKKVSVRIQPIIYLLIRRIIRLTLRIAEKEPVTHALVLN